MFFRLDKLQKTKFPRFYNKMYMGMVNKPWFKTFFNFQWFLMVVCYLYLASVFYSQSERNRILDNPEKMEVVFIDGSKFIGKKIGANSSFHFMLDDSTRVRIIPTSSVKHITKQQLNVKRNNTIAN